jgi:glycosyltransferase involved in cell wall biosynthesis
MCPENGLEIVVDAFILLNKNEKMKNTKMMITGGHTGVDDKYINRIKRKIRESGLESKIIFHDDFEGHGRHDFFSKVSVISVPVLEGEAFGLYLIESMASGIPVVQPALGAFPEIINKSGGGIIYSPNEPSQLADSLVKLLNDPSLIKLLSENGRKGIEDHFNIHAQSQKMIKIYQELIQIQKQFSHASKTG